MSISILTNKVKRKLRIIKLYVVFLARPQLLLERSLVGFKLCKGTFRNNMLLSAFVTPIMNAIVCRFLCTGLWVT